MPVKFQQSVLSQGMLEISGIPTNVSHESLEGKVCEILCDIAVAISEYSIEACHRLRNDGTIVKFAIGRIVSTLLQIEKIFKKLI